MSGRAIILIVVGIILIAGTILYNIEAASTNIVSNFSDYFNRQTAQNIAQSGVNLGLRQLEINRTWRTGFPLKTMLDGKVTVSIFDTIYSGIPCVGIRSTGIAAYGTRRETKVVSTAFAYFPSAFIPYTVKALITSNGPTEASGQIQIDGRDHTTSGTLIANNGKYGIWSTSTFTQSGSSDVGGTTSASIDVAPTTSPDDSAVVKENQVWPYPDPYPSTPDSALGGAGTGYPEGTLRAIAKSGVGGSQYVTDPANLRYPLRGVTYVELPSGGVWGSVVANWDGSGILIVHNAARNAIIENTTGTFVGLIMADDIVHIHSDMIGAILEFTNLPSQGNAIGNGSGVCKYSRDAVQSSLGFLMGLGNNLNVIAWWE